MNASDIIPPDVLTHVSKIVREVLAAWDPAIVGRRKHERLLLPLAKYAQAEARKAMGVRTLTPEQRHTVVVCADSHLSTWETRARSTSPVSSLGDVAERREEMIPRLYTTTTVSR